MDGIYPASPVAVNSQPTQQASDLNQMPRRPGDVQPRGFQIDQMPTSQEPLPQTRPNMPSAVPAPIDAVQNFNALLASLESDDGEEEQSPGDEVPLVGEARLVPDVMLQTSHNRGLDDAEVFSRRKRFGWNRLKEEKRSHIKGFFMFFVGPIQFVMLVSLNPCRFKLILH